MISVNTIWEQFLLIVKEEVGSRVVETWLKAVSFYRWDSIQKIVYLHAPNSFVKEWINANYLSILHFHLGRLLNVDAFKLTFIDALPNPEIEAKIVPAQLVVEHVPRGEKKIGRLVKNTVSTNRDNLNKNYSFDTFIVGPNNQMAYAAAYAVTQKLGKLYNPFFIYGGSGLGKTHLLHAIANELKVKNKQIEVLYQPADRFVNEFINAIRFDKVHQFQMKYKAIDVLLVDDIQCISNKEQTQEAFFNIFNTLYDAHKQIVFSSDSYPTDMEGVAERLRSRLAWGLVADVLVPTFETKIAILQRKADLNNEHLPDDVAHFIASRVVSNIRELEGALIRVTAFATLTNQSISLDLAKKVLRSQDSQQTPIDFERIVKLIGNHYSYTLTDLRSRNRSKQLSLVRQLAMYFMKTFTDKSLHEIALYLGRTDHSTVIHALKQVQERMQIDYAFNEHINRMKENILN